MSTAQANVIAPGFDSGPRVTTSGLLWSTLRGVSLSTKQRAQLIAPYARLPEVSVEDGWTVVANSSLIAGRTGRELMPVPLTGVCLPASDETWHAAIANGNLYTVVQASCLARRRTSGQLLVRVRLSTGVAHPIGRVQRDPISIGAAGNLVALTYDSQPTMRPEVQVRVLDSKNAKTLYTLTAPAPAQDPPLPFQQPKTVEVETQIDPGGDVLLRGTDREVALFGELSGFALWGSSKAPLTAIEGEEPALSHGRLAYLSAPEAGPEQIELLNLKTRKTRAIVTMPGSAMVKGVGLGRNRLAWAQQSWGYSDSFGCIQPAPLGSAELAEAAVPPPGSPLVIAGPPAPPRPAVESECVQPAAAAG